MTSSILRNATVTFAASLALIVTGCPNDDEGSGTANASANNDDDDDDGGATTTGGTVDETTSGASMTAGDDNPPGTADDTADGGVMPPITFDVGGGMDGLPGAGGAVLSGTVWGPNGEIPVSGALVYTSKLEPEGIPQEVYCAECAELDGSAWFTLTNPDGTFELNAAPGDDYYLVVRKGEFMRVTLVDVDQGPTELDDELTTLPDHNDPGNGLYIPLIAVGNGTFDRIEDALGKFGLGDTSIAGFEERLIPNTEEFDLWDNGQSPASDGFTSQGTFEDLVSDPEALAQYHIIFIPCSGDTYLSALSDPVNVENIRNWVAAGGRWYVADWAHEWVREVFPEYQTFHGEPGSGDLGSYDSLADVLDMGLLEWLEAIPDPLKDINPLNDESHPTLYQLPQVQTVDNWSGIQTINPVIVQDKEGNDVDVGYKTWLEGPGGGGISGGTTVPLTVTGQFGCGKIQFTSYHTAEFFDYVGLSPQELVLIYTILEIGVCQDPLPPPIPEG